MKKKSLIVLLIIAMVVTIGTYGNVFADSTAEKQDELNSINNKKSDVTSDMQQLTKDIESQQNQVDQLQETVDAKQAELDKAQADIAKTKQEIQDRKDGLDKRLRTMYKNGSVGYLDVLLGSGSITEFISNLEMIQKIFKNDQDTLETLKEQHEALKIQEAKIAEEKADLDKKKAEAKAKNDILKSEKQKLQAKLEALNEEADRVSSEIANLQDSNKVYEGGKFKWPTTSTYITSPFGGRIHPITGIYTGHTGVDIGVGTGSPVYAAASGKVIVSSWYGGYGYAVVIDHGSGISTLYGHNNSLNVSVGQTVSKGQVVARSGSTGNSTGPHLHFEVRINGSYVDPMQYFR